METLRYGMISNVEPIVSKEGKFDCMPLGFTSWASHYNFKQTTESWC